MHRAAWHVDPTRAIGRLCDWLVAEAPPLLVTAGRERVVWDPAHPDRLDALRATASRGDAAGVVAVHEDLATVARLTRAFLVSLVDPSALPAPSAATEQSGYAYLHRERRLIAYDLDEPSMERLTGPALPWARAMLGARAVHEWAHLAVDAGWVPCVVDARTLASRRAALAAVLDDVVTRLPPPFRDLTAPDLADVARGAETVGAGLVDVFLARIDDYRANVLAQRWLARDEIEAYVRHNIRTLRFEYAPPQLLRMLVRYLFELQYLGFSAVADGKTFLVRSTWFDADFFATRILDGPGFVALADGAAALCASWDVDETRFSAKR